MSLLAAKMLNQSGVIPPPESSCQSAEGVCSPVQGGDKKVSLRESIEITAGALSVIIHCKNMSDPSCKYQVIPLPSH